LEDSTARNLSQNATGQISMKTGEKPGSVIGTMDATDGNFTIKYLSDLAKANQLPCNFIVQCFTQTMVTNYKK
jgi:hypothetical protein